MLHLPIGADVLFHASFSEFVLEAGLQTLSKVVVFGVFAERLKSFSLVEHLANQNAVHSDAAFTSKIHNTRICVTALEKQVVVVLIDEIIFRTSHAFLDSFENKVMPVRRQSQELSKIGHVVLKNHHRNPWVEHAVFSSKLYLSLRFLNLD